MSKYIAPNLIVEPTYSTLLKDYKDYGHLAAWISEEKHIEVEDLLSQGFVFVVGEPGQGKSRLLREVASIAHKKGVGSSIINLNKLARNDSLEDALLGSEEQISFDKDKTSVVGFDALDEVASAKFPEIVQQIRDYNKLHPRHIVVITSRIHFFTKYETSFAGLNASYALLLPLDYEQQVALLKQYELTESQIDVAFRKLKQVDRETVLQTPRYLEYFAQWYSQHRGQNKQALSRSDIFDHFVDRSLKAEDGKVNKKIAALRRRTIEKLALVMETAQVNTISQDEMVTFIEGYRSESKHLLLNTTDDLEMLYNHGLLKDDGEDISFDNAELQEYLAASAINRMENISKVTFDLAVDRQQRSIHPSWYSALSFLLEMHPELLEQIINLNKPTPESVGRPEDPDTHKLISGVNAGVIPIDQRNDIFRNVFSYYIDNDIYIRYEVAIRLAFCPAPPKLNPYTS